MMFRSKNMKFQSTRKTLMSNPNFPTPTTEHLFPLDGIRYGLSHKKDFITRDDPRLDPLHIHETLEIFLNVDSNVSFLVNNRLYPVKKGEALISRANELHVGIFNEAKVHEYFCLWIDADEDSPVFDFLRRENYSSRFAFDAATGEQLIGLFFRLENYINENNDLSKTACFLQIMSVLNEYKNAPETTEAIPQDLQVILDDINENFASMKSVDDIIKNRFISAATLNRRFREYVHLSPKKFLESKKLSYAARLLSDGASVMDACLAAGFSDCSHFIVLFKKKFGETPSKYKKRSVR